MSYILAFDCTEQRCSAALGNGESLFAQSTDEPRQHVKRLLPMIDMLLEEAALSYSDLSAVSVAVGPGSFTGLRIAVSVAQAIAYAHQLKVIPVSSLALCAASFVAERNKMAGGALPEGIKLYPMFDARMGELYSASFTICHGKLKRLCDDRILPINDLAAANFDVDNSFVIGSGAQIAALAEIGFNSSACFAQANDASELIPIALDELSSNNLCSAYELEPAYVRSERAWKKIPDQAKS